MRPARSLAARVTALGVAGVFAAPAAAVTSPMPAAAAPSCAASLGPFAAQSGVESIRIDRLEFRPGGGRTNRAAAEADSKPATDDEQTEATPDRQPARSPRKIEEPAPAPSGKAGLLGGPLLNELTSAGSAPRPVRARKPAGPGSTEDDFTPAPTDAGEADKMPAPHPTTDRAADADSSARPERAAATVVRDVLLGEAKSALVNTGTPSAAAVTRMVNSSERSELSTPLVQQAPPDHAGPARRGTPAADVGPLLVDTGELASHAKWACGTDGEATRAATTLGAAALADSHDDALVAVPEKVASLSTTALERRGSRVRPTATASLAARTIELLDGAVRIKMTRPPSLTTAMPGEGEVRYVPAELEISGEGIKKTTLNAPGDSMEMTFGDRTESGTGRAPVELPVGPALSLPEIPELPVLGSGEPESATADGPGTTVKISLGKLRQAARGGAVAARASAVQIGITERAYGDSKAGVTLAMTIGELESATVAAGPLGGVSNAVAGRAGGLPVTGPGAGLIALGGAALLVSGAAALTLTTRRRRRFRA